MTFAPKPLKADGPLLTVRFRDPATAESLLKANGFRVLLRRGLSGEFLVRGNPDEGARALQHVRSLQGLEEANAVPESEIAKFLLPRA